MAPKWAIARRGGQKAKTAMTRDIALNGLGQKGIVLRNGNDLHGWLDSCLYYEGGTPMARKSDAYRNGTGTHLACHSIARCLI